jgi:hypothetical protein
LAATLRGKFLEDEALLIDESERKRSAKNLEMSSLKNANFW